MLLISVSIVIAVMLVLYGVASFMIANGVTKAEREEHEGHPSEYGLKFEEVEFLPRGGELRLRGWYMEPMTRGPTIILVHGLGGSRSSGDALGLASGLLERGYGVLTFDLRAHGDSEGEKVSGGLHERLDVLGAFDYLVERGVSGSQIGVIGRSMGAATSILAAADEPAIRALVADSPYAVGSELIAQETARKTIFPDWIVPIFIRGADLAAELSLDIDLDKLTPVKAIATLDYPVLVIHTLNDTRIPIEHGIRVHMASHRDSDLWIVSDVDHGDTYSELPEEYLDRVAEYFHERFGAGQP